jgi:cyclase
MVRPRVIPVLLLGERGVVKSRCFRDHRYIGDPLNAARIFSELGADELVVLDIIAGATGGCINERIIGEIADEISMPLAAGGGITTVDDARRLIVVGAEKVVVGTGAWRDPYLLTELANNLGSSAVTVCIDVGTNASGTQTVRVSNGTYDTGLSPADFARTVEDHGAGEIIIQSIDRDGTGSGYDVDLIREISKRVSIPVVALGGAGELGDVRRAVKAGLASAAAAGSLFVYHGRNQGVLINYPMRNEVKF